MSVLIISQPLGGQKVNVVFKEIVEKRILIAFMLILSYDNSNKH